MLFKKHYQMNVIFFWKCFFKKHLDSNEITSNKSTYEHSVSYESNRKQAKIQQLSIQTNYSVQDVENLWVMSH